MNDKANSYLDAFPAWLQSLGDDTEALATVLEKGTLTPGAQEVVAASLNYLFKSLDLIPDGIEDLGFIDDTFIFRVASARALAVDPSATDEAGTLKRLADDATVIAEFLGDDYARLERYVEDLGKAVARGRSVQDILASDEVKHAFIAELRAWAAAFEAPSFTRDEKNLVKLKSFLGTKLPA